MSEQLMPPAAPDIADDKAQALLQYQELVERCAAERLNYLIANGSAVHARILISKLFEIARKQVVLVSGTVSEQSDEGDAIYRHPPVLENAKRFLRITDACLSVIVQSGTIYNGTDNVFLKTVIEDPSRRGTVRLFVPRADILGEAAPHFMVSDSTAYRLETGKNADPKNKTITAVANFGNPKQARSLASLFDGLVGLLDHAGHNHLAKFAVYQPGQAFA